MSMEMIIAVSVMAVLFIVVSLVMQKKKSGKSRIGPSAPSRRTGRLQIAAGAWSKTSASAACHGVAGIPGPSHGGRIGA